MQIKHLQKRFTSEKRDTRKSKAIVKVGCSPKDKQDAMLGYSMAKQYQELDRSKSVAWQYGWNLFWQSMPAKRRMPLVSLREKRIVNS